MLADTLVARNLETRGLCFGDPAKRPAYLRHLYPGDLTPAGEPDAAALEFGASQSSCLLHARGLLAPESEVDGTVVWGGRPVDILRTSYHVPWLGKIEAMLKEIARQRGLLIDHGPALAAIEPADLVVIGSRGSPPDDPIEHANWLAQDGGLAHGVCVTGVSGLEVEGNDGGQCDQKNGGKPTAIARVVRRLEKRANGWWLVSEHGARRITWRFRMGALPCR